jgi:sortase A
LRYEVDWVKVVEPGDTTVLAPSTDESTLTLVTCYPFQYLGSALQRFIVHARRNQLSSSTGIHPEEQ